MVLLGPCVCGLSFPETVPFKRVYTNWIPCLISSLPLQCLAHSRASEIFLVEIPKGITLAALTRCHLYLRQSALRKTKASNHFSFTNRYIFFLSCAFSHERILVQSNQNNSCLHSLFNFIFPCSALLHQN